MDAMVACLLPLAGAAAGVRWLGGMKEIRTWG